MANYLKTARDADMADYAMVGYTLRNTLSEFGSVSRGVCQHEGDYLRRVIELTKIEKKGDRIQYIDEQGQAQPLSGDEIVSLNMWGFTPSIFDHLQEQFSLFLQERGREPRSELYIPTVVDTLITQKKARVRILPSQESWFGITYQEDKPHVAENIRRLIAQGVYPERLWSES
jgi:hypothetical protein